MSAYTARVVWQRNQAPFTDNRYSRAHEWVFDGGVTVPASASPHVVPTPMSEPANVDPEEAFVVALSSCHMLFFLSFAARQGYVVDAYADDAVGHMEKDGNDRWVMTKVTLRPQIHFSGERIPDAAQIDALHHEAHTSCFLANSVKTEIAVEAR